MPRCFAFLLPLAVVAVGCGSTSTTTTAPPASTSTGQSTVSAAPTALTIFRLRDGVLQPEAVEVPHTTAVAAAALVVLGLAAPVTIANGTAVVAIETATPGAVAEIVYTLTEFPTIKRVDVAGRRGLTRDDVQGFLPTIFIEAPAANATVRSTFSVTGSATVFEATFVVELDRDGKVLVKRTVTASEGAPARGTFATTLHATAAGVVTIAAFAPSAENGEPQHEVDVPVKVGP